MPQPQYRCLILACGNTLREDDGVGPWLAEWAQKRFSASPAVRVLSDHQWTPEIVEEIARAESVIFIDCATDCAPGLVRTSSVEPAAASSKLGTHHLDAAQLLALSQQLYSALPRNSLLLTVGAGSLQLREGFSDAVKAALPHACKLLEEAVQQSLSAPGSSAPGSVPD
jgi:hydrogenase maturation protease